MANFAITNVCNAYCVHCSFPLAQEKDTISLEDAQSAITSLRRLGVGIVSITGGEPFMVPHLPDIVKHASQSGMIVYTGTNGTRSSEDMVRELARSGLDGIWISVDSDSPERFETMRGVPGLTAKVKESVKLFEKYGLNTYAITVINRSISDFGNLLEFLEELGFRRVKFDYPMRSQLQSSYMGYSNSRELQFSAEEITGIVGQILSLKKKANAVSVMNPSEGLRGLADFYNGRQPKYGCYAGKYLLYLDWKARLYRCTYRSDTYGNAGSEADPSNLDRIPCNLCYYQGCRDYDALYFFVDSLYNTHVFDRRNIGGIKALLEFYSSGFL
ncbi:MAG: radical SAM protein [Thermoplasmata archaeon]